MDYDDNWLSDYEVWQREDDYEREVCISIQLDFEAEDRLQK